MLKNICFVRLAVTGLLAFGAGARVEAQAPAASKLPSPQIAAAKSVFIMNAGSENPPAETAQELMFFTGGPDRAYNEFYSTMKDWGRFRLVPSPAGADLIVEIQYVRHPQRVDSTNESEDAACMLRNKCQENPGDIACNQCTTKTTSFVKAFFPQLDLIVREGETHAVLRTFTHLVEIGNVNSRRNKGDDRQKALDRNFDEAMNSLVRDFGDLASGSKAPMPVYFSDVGVAPTPSQITQARKVWIARARPDSGRPDSMDMDPTSSDLAYNTFYALIKNGGRFEIADAPAAADLILQISTNTNETISPLYAERRINLTVVDPKTGTGLWTLMQDATKALLPRNARRNEQQTVADVVYKLTGLAGRLTLTSIPKTIDTAPPPVLFSAGQKVFIANAIGRVPGAKPGETYQAYGDFYAAMKKWGYFELVSAPGLADMIFELSLAGKSMTLHIADTRTRTALLDLAMGHNSKNSGTDDFSEAFGALLPNSAQPAGQADRKSAGNEETGRAPAQLAAAKTVFIAFPHTGLNASVENADELYYKAFSEPGRWGRFEITPIPAQADLIADLEVEGAYRTYFRLTFRDPKTRAVLWAVRERLDVPFLQRNLEKSVQKTIDALMNDAREVVGAQSVARSAKQLSAGK